MARQKVAILGCTGMLGSMLLDTFANNYDFQIIATYRDGKIGRVLKGKYPKVDFRKLDIENRSLKTVKDAEWIINAIGITKPYIHDDNSHEVKQAISVNAIFPHFLAQTNSKVIQIATDCVYSGKKGRYKETDLHNAQDAYGKTKSLGEVWANNIYHLRSSIIGPELKGHCSLLDWFLSQPNNSQVNGFTNHKWNGITTLHFAKICTGIIKSGIDLPHVQHIVPANIINKANLLKNFAKEFKRPDIKVININAPIAINRSLETNNIKLNRQLWRLAGYKNPPTIESMIKELAK